MTKPFQFKQFTVAQDLCGMKIGTDGVLLGAWTSLTDAPNAILDVGAGTGILALQMAQRSQAATIDAVELDANAHLQCVDNFESSPWADRLFCYHCSFQEFAQEVDEAYDLIISNPPFYLETVSSASQARDMARQNEALPFGELFNGVHTLLARTGTFALIVPYTLEGKVVETALEFDLRPYRFLRVRGHATAAIKRSLLQFSFDNRKVIKEELIIEEERHRFTERYKDLTKDFYLKM